MVKYLRCIAPEFAVTGTLACNRVLRIQGDATAAGAPTALPYYRTESVFDPEKRKRSQHTRHGSGEKPTIDHIQNAARVARRYAGR